MGTWANIYGNYLCYDRKFLNDLYSEEKKIPSWVGVALKEAKLDIELDYEFYET